MLGYSTATWEQTRAVFDISVDGLIHCYNGMAGLHHREPGMAGAGLTDPHAQLELTAGGHHVYPVAMKLYCCYTRDRLMLITDAMQAARMPNGRYTFCGEEVEMHSGIVRTVSGGLAGSTFSVNVVIRNVAKLTGITTEEAIYMASPHLARPLGIDRQLGLLAVGKCADAIALNGGLHLQQIWIQGQVLPL